MTYHQTIILGNLGRDPELRYLPSGTAVCNLNVAVNEYWTDRQTNERREKTTWYRVAVWGQQAETVNTYLKKGSQVLVTGTVEARAYMDNSGQPAASLELRARDIKFAGGREDSTQGGQQGDYDQFAPPSNEDEIPF